VLLCTGKIYYDLLAKQREEKRQDVAIIRVEQLYPLPAKQLDKAIGRYGDVEVFWVQEEPANNGAWHHMKINYDTYNLKGIARKASASPATGFKKVHDKQQADIVKKAFE
jgi:2-oxoglutarate dehydrogenase E1 component